MDRILLKNGRIVTVKSKGPKFGEEMADLSVIERGYVVVENGIILDVGSGEGLDYVDEGTEVIDLEGRTVLPGLVDSHTHLVHYGSRENELKLKLEGASYLDILKQGGGILSTVRATRSASYENLYKKALKSLDLMLLWGTTTVEAKSGYGLNFEDEVKCLKVAKEIEHPIDIVSTYLGAHAIPEEYKGNVDGYIDLMIEKVMPYVKKEGLAEYVDAFCEEGFFDIEQTRRVLKAAKELGFQVKLHADEIEPMGGAQLAAELGAVSAEHLVAVSDEGIDAMKEAGVIPILLPGTSFYLKLKRYAPAREMIRRGLAVAVASDYNPGTCPTESLQSIMVFASLGMGLTPQEVISAITINAAYAIGRGSEVGSIEKGKKADLVVMNALNENYIIYHFGINHVDMVIKNGKIVVRDGRLIY
ncbi:imidazolonepropionase [Thermobrachium celere]|uniref:imidazolonepropionase n=1 Tax=Thermobrachium celere TaxID=53422 RepID=UPI001A5633DE|nr:imidazolonepropionase [Thermobrachium celere]GFR36105.1 imidazolonepropionase [Thermobrachium celere]